MAEVKVKITAANQTQTGFQSVLADAQRTATQVQQTFARASAAPRMPQVKQPGGSSGPIDIDIGDYGLEPLRELQEELRKVRERSKQAFDVEPPQQFSNGIGGIIGRFALIVGGAATVGKIIASAFDQAGEAIKRSIGIQEQFNRALAQAGQTTTFDGAVSGFQQLNALADQTGKTIEETFGRNIGEAIANLFQGRPGQLLANLGNALTGGAVRGDLEDTQEQQRRIARDTLSGNLAVQQQEREELLGAGGNAGAISRLKREQEKRREVEALRSSFTDLSQPEQSADFEKLSQALKEKQATDDLIEAQKRLAAAKDEAAAAGRERSQAGMSSAQRLEQEKAAMQELRAEQAKFAQAASMAGVDPTGGLTEAAAKYYELQARIEQSQGRQQTLEAAIAKEIERKAAANVPMAVEVSGLSSVQELEAALDAVEPKVEVSGLASVQELEAALDAAAQPIDISALLSLTGAEDLDALRQSIAAEDGKTISLALQATGLSDVDALRAALDAVEPKQVSVALQATGLQSAEELKSALEIEDKTVIANLQAAGFENIQQLQLQLNQLEPKQVDVILNALGAENIEEAQKLIQSLDSEARKKIDQTRSKELERAAEQKKRFDQDIALAEAKLRGDKGAEEDILQQRDIDQSIEGGATFEQAANIAALNSMQRNLAKTGNQGSIQASSLQRIGFASNEFFDSRRKEDPVKSTARIAEDLRKLVDIMRDRKLLIMTSDF
jgi:hypothetical protein